MKAWELLDQAINNKKLAISLYSAYVQADEHGEPVLHDDGKYRCCPWAGMYYTAFGGFLDFEEERFLDASIHRFGRELKMTVRGLFTCPHSDCVTSGDCSGTLHNLIIHLRDIHSLTPEQIRDILKEKDL